MCAHTGKYWRMPAEENNKDAVWCNKMSGSEINYIWHSGLIPASKTNEKEAKTSYISELLCSSIVDPPQHVTIIAKADSGVSNNYCCTEDMLLLTNLKDTRDVPTVQLPNNATMNEAKTDSIPMLVSLLIHAKKAHVFYGIHSTFLISLRQLCDDDFIAIFDKNYINILKNKTLILKGYRNNTDGLWDIPISRPLIHRAPAIVTRDKTKTELIQYLCGCCFSSTQRNFLKVVKM